jgi:glycine/D-amino acid oxidase-like deaminating enzyme
VNRTDWPPSLWATVTPPGPALEPLAGPATADVVVIGAGFTGLSTALHLRERGRDVLVVEAMAPGWGASGRNNGQVIPTLSRPDPDEIIAQHGAAGERFVSLLRDSASILFDIVRRYALAAEAEQSGWVQPVHTPGRMRIAERRVAQWSRHGAPVALLSRDAVRERLGSDYWHGGWANPTGGHINPLALSRELARIVVAKGGRIVVETPVTGFARDGDGWRVRTTRGDLRARALVLATNGYTGEIVPGLAPRIARQVVPVLSWQMATEPIGANMRAKIMPGREAVSDTHGDLYFARYDQRHRLVTGGALIIAANGAERLKRRIGARLARLFPDLADVRFDYVWNGYIGMTADFMPRVHRLGPDGYGWVGCNGRAVALSVALGRELAAAVSGQPIGELALPLSEPAPLPGHAVVRRLAPIRLLHYRWRDGREIA